MERDEDKRIVLDNGKVYYQIDTVETDDGETVLYVLNDETEEKMFAYITINEDGTSDMLEITNKQGIELLTEKLKMKAAKENDNN